jgi:hypothetical protein
VAGKQQRSHWNIDPVHQNYESFGTSASGSPVNLYLQDSAAFQNFTSFGSTASASSLKTSGYQYALTVTSQVTAHINEYQALGEGPLFKDFSSYISEFQPSHDGLFDGTSHVPEHLSLGDSWFTKIQVNIHEFMPPGEAWQKIKTDPETLNLGDSVVSNITTFISEHMPVGDKVQGVYPLTGLTGITSQIFVDGSQNDSFRGTIEVYDTTLTSLNVSITQFNLSPVVSISALPPQSDVTPVINITTLGVPYYPPPISVESNPFESTVILGGTTYATNPSTAPNPDTITVDSNFIRWLNVGVGGANSCTFLNFSCELNQGGGTFTVVSSAPLIVGATTYAQNLTQPIEAFGYNATITDWGQVANNSQFGYTTKGIFGSPTVYKQLNALLQGTALAMLTNSLLVYYQETQLQTYAGFAQAIATAANVNLQWVITDFSLVNFTVQQGETAISALQSIAGQFGGTLRWNGGNNYLVCYPDFISGQWELPSDAILSASGMEYVYHLDLTQGVYAGGFYGSQITVQFDPSQLFTPGFSLDDSNPVVQRVSGLKNVILGSEDPTWVTDLPLDTTELFWHVLVNPSNPNFSSTSGTGGRTNPITGNPEQWVSLGSPGLSNQYCTYTQKGGAGGAIVPQATIPYSLMTDITSNLSAIGDFIVEIGVTRNNQSNLLQEAINLRNQQIENQMALYNNSFAYTKVYEGTISCYFFGSIPTPGMWATATSACAGFTVEGIIESVSFNFPGILTIQVAQYMRVPHAENYYYVNLLQLAGYNDTIGVPPPQYGTPEA